MRGSNGCHPFKCRGRQIDPNAVKGESADQPTTRRIEECSSAEEPGPKWLHNIGSKVKIALGIIYKA